jgi:DNA-binding transcriptional regulator YiaG
MHHHPTPQPDEQRRANLDGLPATAPLTAHTIRYLRRRKRESQETFWRRFGVTQSSGSRFESGLPLPATLAILLRLYAEGKLTDALLDA